MQATEYGKTKLAMWVKSQRIHPVSHYWLSPLIQSEQGYSQGVYCNRVKFHQYLFIRLGGIAPTRNIDRQTSEQGDSKYPKPKLSFRRLGGGGGEYKEIHYRYWCLRPSAFPNLFACKDYLNL